MSPSHPDTAPSRARGGIDPLGALLAVVGLAATTLLPFVVFKANRIMPGDARSLLAVLPIGLALGFDAVLLVIALAALLAKSARLRLVLGLVGVVAVALAIGAAADLLTPPGNRTVRISPGSGFWVLLIALGLFTTDAVARLSPGPGRRVLGLVIVALVLGAAFHFGLFDHLSIMREYAGNASRFAREARQHVLLALG